MLNVLPVSQATPDTLFIWLFIMLNSTITTAKMPIPIMTPFSDFIISTIVYRLLLLYFFTKCFTKPFLVLNFLPTRGFFFEPKISA